MSTMNQPEVVMTVTPGRGRRGQEVHGARRASIPAVGGLRVSVQPGGCSGFKYGLLIEDAGRRGRSRRRPGRLPRVRRSVLGAVHRAASRSTTSRRCRAPASPSRIRTRPAAAAAAAPSRPERRSTDMTVPVTGARRDVGAGHGGPRSLSDSRAFACPAHAARHRLERIRTVVVDDHEDLARLVADRIATAHPRAQRHRRAARCSASPPAPRRSACTAS